MSDGPIPDGITPDDWANTPPAVRAQLWQALQSTADQDGPYDGLMRLSERLEATVAPDAVLPLIVETIARALRLPYAAITLKRTDADEFELAAEYRQGATEAEPFILPLLYQMEMVGQLIVRPRASDEPWTSAEQDLVTTIAQHAGVAASIVRMTSDLQRARERLVLAREEERRRLRRNLHDTIGPTLAALNLKAGALRALIERDPNAALMQMTELREQIRTVIADIRRVVYDLRPPALDELGMLTAIREQAAQFSMEGLHVAVQAPDSLPALPAALEVATYRIVMEALTNVARHAQARHGWIRLSVTDEIHIEVTDDGIGMPPMLRAGVGLSSIRERATELGGTCLFEPVPGGGTRVLARLPLSVSALSPEREGPPLNFAVRSIERP
jgi:signal transduction histidine kinase